MRNRDITFKSGGKGLLAWLAALPFLLSWPVLSTFPAISILSGPPSTAAFLIEALFLATGLWGCLSMFLVLMVLARDDSVRAWRPSRPLTFAYIVAWTVIYSAYALWIHS